MHYVIHKFKHVGTVKNLHGCGIKPMLEVNVVEELHENYLER